MLSLELNLDEKTATRFRKVLSLYANQEEFVQNVISYQVEELKRGIINLEIEMRALEKKYHLSSEKFYEKFQSGELGDDEDYILWAGVYELWTDNKKQLLGLE